jgi:hypothetical protein
LGKVGVLRTVVESFTEAVVTKTVWFGVESPGETVNLDGRLEKVTFVNSSTVVLASSIATLKIGMASRRVD